MIERQLWHPVARSEALAAGAPLALALLGDELVLWRDAQGIARAFTDRCPHRGARLSMGRVEAGELECPYHGWRFEGGGRCVAIPALPDFEPPATHRACSHAPLEAAGMLWLRLDEGGAAAPAIGMLEAAERDPALRKLTVGPYEVATSAPRIVENFLDLSHFGLVHEGWLGDRAHLAQPPYEVHTAADGTLVASGCRAWQPQSNRLSAAGSEVDYRYEVPAPFMAVLSKAPQGQPGYRDVIALLVCPLTPESSRVWFRMALTDFDSSDAEIAAFQDTIFAQDRPVLESQRPRRLPITEAAPVRELHSAADRLSSAYRRMLVARSIAFGIC